MPKKKAVQQYASSDEDEQQDLDPEHNSAHEDKVCDKDKDGNQADYGSSGKICF